MRLEVRRSYNSCSIRHEPEWPLRNAKYTPLFLDARTGGLVGDTPQSAGTVDYDPNAQGASGRASFIFSFAGDTEITGGATLKLWVSTTEGDDLDLFAVLRKFDADGWEVSVRGFVRSPSAPHQSGRQRAVLFRFRD